MKKVVLRCPYCPKLVNAFWLRANMEEVTGCCGLAVFDKHWSRVNSVCLFPHVRRPTIPCSVRWDLLDSGLKRMLTVADNKGLLGSKSDSPPSQTGMSESGLKLKKDQRSVPVTVIAEGSSRWSPPRFQAREDCCVLGMIRSAVSLQSRNSTRSRRPRNVILSNLFDQQPTDPLPSPF